MEPVSPANVLIAGVYYVLVGILTFFSLFGVYVLIRYGKSRTTALGVSLLYVIFFLTILTSSYRTLGEILG